MRSKRCRLEPGASRNTAAAPSSSSGPRRRGDVHRVRNRWSRRPNRFRNPRRERRVRRIDVVGGHDGRGRPRRPRPRAGACRRRARGAQHPLLGPFEGGSRCRRGRLRRGRCGAARGVAWVRVALSPRRREEGPWGVQPLGGVDEAVGRRRTGLLPPWARGGWVLRRRGLAPGHGASGMEFSFREVGEGLDFSLCIIVPEPMQDLLAGGRSRRHRFLQARPVDND